jgi:hypothetical protein
VLLTNGNLYEYTDFTGTWSNLLASNVVSISAGTDRAGVNAVDAVFTSGYAYERSDSTGWHTIASGVRSVSAGQQGMTAYVSTSGSAYQWFEATGLSSFLASSVAQVTAGTDANGNWMLDLLFSNGNLSEYRQGQGWTSLAQSVAWINKARAGQDDVVFSGGAADAHNANGTWTYLDGAVQMVV